MSGKRFLEHGAAALVGVALAIPFPSIRVQAGEVLSPAAFSSAPGKAPAAGETWKEVVAGPQNGPQLPLPAGLGAVYWYQENDYKLNKLNAEVPEIEFPSIELPPELQQLLALPPAFRPPGILPPGLPVIAPGSLPDDPREFPPELLEFLGIEIPEVPEFSEATVKRISNKVHNVSFTPDYWVLPFLNIEGILGYADGEARVILEEPFQPIAIDYSGVVYGGGATLAAGTKHLFGAVHGSYTKTALNEGDSSIRTWVARPMAGVHNKHGAIYGGAMYENTRHQQTGSLAVDPVGDVMFEAMLEDAANWNWLVGTRINICRNLTLIGEGGFGPRKHAKVKVTFRF